MTEHRQDQPSTSFHGQRRLLSDCNKNDRRVRSRAIAIKKPASAQETRELDDEEMRICSNERMYDWATWRMYHRIMEHRLKHPVGTDYDSEAQPGMGSPTPTTRNAFLPMVAHENIQIAPAAHIHFDDLLEGEIFELEM